MMHAKSVFRQAPATTRICARYNKSSRNGVFTEFLPAPFLYGAANYIIGSPVSIRLGAVFLIDSTRSNPPAECRGSAPNSVRLTIPPAFLLLDPFATTTHLSGAT